MERSSIRVHHDGHVATVCVTQSGVRTTGVDRAGIDSVRRGDAPARHHKPKIRQGPGYE